MTTITININEKTVDGKKVLDFLKKSSVEIISMKRKEKKITKSKTYNQVKQSIIDVKKVNVSFVKSINA